jgi:hypothetical protein
MKTYEITYEVKVVITADNKGLALNEAYELLMSSDSGVADYIVASVQQKSINAVEMENM